MNFLFSITIIMIGIDLAAVYLILKASMRYPA